MKGNRMKSSTNGRKRINQADAAARRRLKRTISRAREGFEDDAENLAIAMIDEEVPADQKVFAARALIDATCILAGSINKLELPSSPISRCLAALYHLDPGFFIKHRHALQDRYMPSLPQFSSWIFNVLKVAANSDESKSIEMILVNAIRGIDLVRAYDPKSDDDGGILGSDAALKLATRIWLRQSQAQDGAVATNLFLRMLFPTKDGACPIPRSQSTIFKAASSIGLSAKVVIKLLLDRIRNAEERFILILPFTVPLPNDRSQLTTMQRAFADQRGVKIILKALRSIFVEIGFDFRSPDASRLTNMQGKAISEGVYVLNYLLTLWPGLVLLKKALNSGLLRVLAFCSVPCILSRLDENAGGHIHSIVSKTLLDSMVILRISKSARNAVTKCRVLKPCLDERSGCDKPVPPQLHKSEVWDAWALLFNSIRHHIKASEVFSSERKLEVVACGNASCLRKELRANFHKCAGCESVYFCSMPCHAAAWMLHCHKQMCMKYQNQRENMGISSLEVDYLARLAREDIRKSLYHSLTTCREGGVSDEVLADKQAVSLCYAVDERASCFAVSFFNWEAAKRKDDPFVHHLPRGPDFPIVAREDGPEDTEDVEMIICVQYGLGREKHSIYVAVPVPVATFEGRLCICCRFHKELTDHHGCCAMHSGK